MPDSFDVLAQLDGCSWRGVPFPLVSLEDSFEHDGVDHEWVDRDGGHVEATGRKVMPISMTIPFRNGTAPGRNELWGGRVLYPDVFNAFRLAFADRTSGELIHPELGRLICKPKTFRRTFDVMKRDGCDVSVTWKQSDDNESDLVDAFSQPSPIGSAKALAADLDQLVGELHPAPLPPDDPSPSFSDMMNGLQALADAPGKLSQQIGGAIDNIAGKIDRLNDAVDRLNNVRLWPIKHALEHLASVNIDLRKNLLSNGQTVKVFRVDTATTIASLSARLKTSIGDLIKLNPGLANTAKVERETLVRYYAT